MTMEQYLCRLSNTRSMHLILNEDDFFSSKNFLVVEKDVSMKPVCKSMRSTSFIIFGPVLFSTV